MIKNYLKSYIYLLGMIIILTILISIISYLSLKPMNITKGLIPIISMFIASVILGMNAKEKGYIEGIKFSLIYIIIMVIMKLIFRTSFDIKIIVFYLILIFTSILGSMLGINLKKK